MIAPSDESRAGTARPQKINVRILRQDGPGKPSYWERHQVNYEPDMNIISVLQKVAANAMTSEGRKVAPVAWDCGCLEEVCGSCTMVINGRVRQSCSALVDRLLEESGNEIELRPMSKFPVVRDLCVDRSRLFRSLQKVKAWVPADGYYDMGAGPRIGRSDQEQAYPLSQCMSCGCCLEACPQYTKIELQQRPTESDAEFQARKKEAYDQGFLGAAPISQAVLFNS
ncbi:MAG: succinate dehydrogenase iron-sulfur subunit, partial [Pirellulaceae bacterium]